jgi:CspA family cold shock protein
MKGIVKTFSDKKGFGFIQPEGEGKDIFVHYSSIQSAGYKTLLNGQHVIFDVVNSAKGPNAINVRIEHPQYGA